MKILEVIAAFFKAMAELPFILRYLNVDLGPDWLKKKQAIQFANDALRRAKTPEEEDAALLAITRAFHHIDDK